MGEQGKLNLGVIRGNKQFPFRGVEGFPYTPAAFIPYRYILQVRITAGKSSCRCPRLYEIGVYSSLTVGKFRKCVRVT